MTKEATKDLAKIKRFSMELQAGLDSPDREVAKKAEAQLGQVRTQLRAWAKKHKITLVQHTEEDGGAGTRRRRCESFFFPNIDGHLYGCFLIGKQRRKCLYDCILNLPTE